MKRPPATTVYYGLTFGLRLPTWVVMAVYLVRELHFSPLQLVLMGTAMEAAVFLFEVPTGIVADTYSRRLSLIIGYLGTGAAWAAVGLVSAPWLVIALWAFWETGFVRRPREERAAPIAELRRTAVRGGRYAWAQPIVMLLIGVELFMGTSSEAFDRLKEAHFLRDIGLPAVGSLDPVVWFGIFWLAGMVLNIAAIGSLIRRVERGGRQTVAQFLFGFTVLELAAMLLFALTGSTWAAIGGLLGVFFARNMQGPLYDTWLSKQITDSSVRATVFSITGQANAVGQAGGGPVLGVLGNIWGIRTALTAGALAIGPALGFYGRAIAHEGREPELAELPLPAAVD